VEPPPAERPGVKSLTHQQKGTKTPAETITHTRHDQTRQTHERSRLNPAGDGTAISEAFDAGVTGVLSWPTSYAKFAPPRLTRDLSEREKEVLALVAAGLSNPRIGTELGLSTTSIKGHLTRIGHVIGTGNRCHMVLIALRAGVL